MILLEFRHEHRLVWQSKCLSQFIFAPVGTILALLLSVCSELHADLLKTAKRLTQISFILLGSLLRASELVLNLGLLTLHVAPCQVLKVVLLLSNSLLQTAHLVVFDFDVQLLLFLHFFQLFDFGLQACRRVHLVLDRVQLVFELAVDLILARHVRL